MEPVYNNLLFEGSRNDRRITDENAAGTAADGARVILDSEICRALAEYVKRYAADDALIEVKGKLIKYIRGI